MEGCDLGVKKAHGWFNMIMSPTAVRLCGGGREKSLEEPMAMNNVDYTNPYLRPPHV